MAQKEYAPVWAHPYNAMLIEAAKEQDGKRNWNLLMNLIEKIENIPGSDTQSVFIVTMKGDFFSISRKDSNPTVVSYGGPDRYERVMGTILTFLLWYKNL